MNTATIIFFGMALTATDMAAAAPACEARSGANTGALLELYTSEGCSSCPPADRWFAGLAASPSGAGISQLAFHVDYWDDIGWPDRFAQHAFTVRQSQRVKTGGSSTIYTPQVMLSSRLDLRWYKPEQVTAALAEVQARPAKVSLHLRARPDNGAWHVEVGVDAHSHSPLGPGSQLYLALYENGLGSEVKSGENAGATLHHDRVVRGLWGPWPLPAAGTAHGLRVTPSKNSRVTQLGHTGLHAARSVPGAGCDQRRDPAGREPAARSVRRGGGKASGAVTHC